MAVYTQVRRDHLESFLRDFRVGKLLSHEGIKEGVENTNYFVSTDRGKYVLTLFETVHREELPYFLELTAHLADKRLPCARPVPDHRGRHLHELCGRPAALVERLGGHSIATPGIEHCRAVGRILALLHLAGTDFPRRRPPSRGPAWWRRTARRLASRLDPDETELLWNELRFQDHHELGALPGGVIHSDLFRDNVLFLEGPDMQRPRLSGVIDFYYACHWCYVYDLAVTVNDWCPHDPRHTRALLQAYRAERPQEAAERDAWPVALRASALRFWLSRLYDRHFPRPGALTQTKDPEIFRKLLERRRAEGAAAPPVPPVEEAGAYHDA